MASRTGANGWRRSMKRFFGAGNTSVTPSPSPASCCRAGATHSATPSDRYRSSTAAKCCKKARHRAVPTLSAQYGEYRCPPSRVLKYPKWEMGGEGKDERRSWARNPSCQTESLHLIDNRSDVSPIVQFREESVTLTTSRSRSKKMRA